MQVHIPDPDYTSSERARANFRLAAKIALGFVALLWLLPCFTETGLRPHFVVPTFFLSIRGRGAGVRVDAGVVEASFRHCVTGARLRR